MKVYINILGIIGIIILILCVNISRADEKAQEKARSLLSQPLKYRNSIYIYKANPKTFKKARLSCQGSKVGDVVRIEDDKENSWILEKTKEMQKISQFVKDRNIYIRLPSERKLLAKGTGGWAPGEPKGYSSEECVEMLVHGRPTSAEGKWNDIGCQEERNYWCEEDLSKYCPEDFMNYESHFCYMQLFGKHIWKTCEDARKYCNEYDAQLVTVRNKNEADMITKLAQEAKIGIKYLWIGLQHDGSKTWKWESGVSAYMNWASNYPINPETHPCAAIDVENGCILNLKSNDRNPFMCLKVGYCDLNSNPRGLGWCGPSGGSCTDKGCVCEKGYVAVPKSKKHKSFCAPSCKYENGAYCLNGGICRPNVVDGMTNVCECINNHWGDRCENKVNECHVRIFNHDLNRDVCRCVDMEDGYKCEWKQPGYRTVPIPITYKNQRMYKLKIQGSCYYEVANKMPCIHGICRAHSKSYACYCYPGWKGVRCDIDVDECREIGEPCGLGQQMCYNTEGGYDCQCKPGFTRVQKFSQVPPDEVSLHHAGGNKYYCEDINECHENRNGLLCGRGHGTPEVDCVNIMGGYRCKCKPGYKLLTDVTKNYRQERCVDVDECNGKTGPVDPSSKKGYRNPCKVGVCLNRLGTWTCHCAPGYLLSSTRIRYGDHKSALGPYCQDVDECEDVTKCGAHQGRGRCLNTPGGFQCTCARGFLPDYKKRECRNVDDCMRSQSRDNLCGVGSCNDTDNGSWSCSCPRGYTLTGKMNYKLKGCAVCGPTCIKREEPTRPDKNACPKVSTEKCDIT